MKKNGMIALLGAVGAALAAPLLAEKLLELKIKRSDRQPGGRFFTSDLGDVHFWEEGHGRPLLLLHSPGPGASHLLWEKNMRELGKRFHVYALDLPGFGWSDKPKITYTAYTYARMLTHFVREAVGRPVAVAAQGDAAAAAVLASSMEPALFRRLVLVNPTGVPVVDAATGEAGNGTPPAGCPGKRLLETPNFGQWAYLHASSREFLRRMVAENVAEPRRLGERETMARYIPAHLGGAGNRYALASWAARTTTMDVRKQLAELKIPVYGLFGEGMEEAIAAFRQVRPRAEVLIFENTRQWPQLENPRAFNRELEEILKG